LRRGENSGRSKRVYDNLAKSASVASRLRGLAAALVWLAATPARADLRAGRVSSDTGPDAAAYGAAEGYPIGTRITANQQRFLVGSYSHFDQLFDVHTVSRTASPSPLQRAARELRTFYTFRSVGYDLVDYLKRNPVTGLLIAQGDTILFEHYQYGRSERDRFTSHSMAKTITSMLVGIAVGEHAIRSIDDPASTYVPELAGSEYGATSIRALLHMSSGVQFREDYDGADDIARLGRGLFVSSAPGTVASIAQFNTRLVPPGTAFHYASVESELLGLILRRAVGMSVAEYLRSRIWVPIGAEADATWIVDASGQEATYCCFNAVLRDYARFALLLAHDGAWQGRQLIPRDWLLEATSVAAADGFLAPRAATPYYGYGFQLWLLPGPHRRFALLGIHGQTIFVDPELRLVMVQTAVRVLPAKDPAAAETVALWNGVIRELGGDTSP
jgi:CubicO group peptidase (beta-lactamase class C family)